MTDEISTALPLGIITKKIYILI